MDNFGYKNDTGSALKILLKFVQLKKSRCTSKLEKVFIQDNWVILSPKMICCHNSGSALIICFKFCTMKGANKHKKINVFFFLNSSKNSSILGLKKMHGHNSGSALRILLDFLKVFYFILFFFEKKKKKRCYLG